jgi:DNA-binding transcriptional LysR family regulator
MIDVRRLRLLRELAARGTVAAVADALSYTPSAVSQQLAVLEREAGVRLLERAGRGVRLTSAGQVLVGHAEAVLARLEQAEADLAAAAGGIAGTIRIASFQTGAGALVAPTIRKLGESHPRLRCELLEMEAEESLPALRLGDVDVAVAEEYEHAPRPRDPALERHDLGRDRLVLVLPRDHPAAASGRPVPLRRLSGETWISGREGTRFADMFERAVRSVGGFEPDIRHRSNDIALLIGTAADGVAVALVPTLGRPEEHSDVAVRELAGKPLDRTVFAAVRRGSAGHPAVSLVLEHLHAASAAAGLVGGRPAGLP